jgi:fructosamine-3-kinase
MSGLPERIGAGLGIPLTEFRQVGSQHGYRHVTGTLADGRRIFAKVAPGDGEPRASREPEGNHESEAAHEARASTAPRVSAAAAAFAAEANGLRWLAAADGGPPVPRVIGVTGDFLVIERLEPLEPPTPRAARRLGAGLARMHAAGASSFGAPWPGFIASLPLDNAPPASTAPASTARANVSPASAVPGRAGTDWGSWYAERRLRPYLRRAHDAGLLSRADVSLLETVLSRIGELAGPAEPPSRIHGDLWAGNVLWADGRGWLIDPAAHGGHRETDLAMLALFGAPHLADILQGYTETSPLADGWRSRVPLHQLHPLLVHVCLFGAGYTAQLVSAARTALAAKQPDG